MIFRLSIFSALSVFFLMNTSNKQTSIVKLDNGFYSIEYNDQSFMIDPNLGARVLSAKINGKELLLQKRDLLVNWGATFWPAPQSRWNWPPPNAFQRGKFVPEVKQNQLILTGEVDPKIGLRAVKIFSFDEAKNCLEIEYQIINESESDANVGPWEIVCVPADGSKVFLQLGTTPENVKSSLAFDNLHGIGWFDYDAADLLPDQKLFTNTPEGWLAYINPEGILFIKTFEVVPAEQLTPGQGNAEVYVSKKMEYIELENHGEFAHLKPHESLRYKVRWFMSELPDSVSGKSMSPGLMEYIHDIIE